MSLEYLATSNGSWTPDGRTLPGATTGYTPGRGTVQAQTPGVLPERGRRARLYLVGGQDFQLNCDWNNVLITKPSHNAILISSAFGTCNSSCVLLVGSSIRSRGERTAHDWDRRERSAAVHCRGPDMVNGILKFHPQRPCHCARKPLWRAASVRCLDLGLH